MIYLDNSATTRPSAGVIAAMTEALGEGWYNPSSLYAPSVGVEKQLDACRDKIRAALHAGDARVIFTSGGTEANNLALAGVLGVSRPPLRVAVSAVEHPSVFETAALLGAEYAVIGVDHTGALDYAQLEAECQKGLTLVSVMQVNNETGAKTDVKRLYETVKRCCPACLVHVDGVQGFLREEMDFRYADLYTCSSHKIHGPKGVGALVAKKNLRLKPSHTGGGQEQGLRSGTENTPGILGFSRAIDEMLAMPDRRARLMELKLRLARGLTQAIPEAAVNGPAPEDGACHILNVSFIGVRGETMLHALEEKRIYVSTGSACSAKKQRVSRVLDAMHVPHAAAESAVRFSLCPYTTEEEIDEAVAAVKSCYELLKRFQRR